MILTSDLTESADRDRLWRAGRLVAENGKLLATSDPHLTGPPMRGRRCTWASAWTQADFAISAPEGANTARAKVIGVVENQAPTKALEATLNLQVE